MIFACISEEVKHDRNTTKKRMRRIAGDFSDIEI